MLHKNDILNHPNIYKGNKNLYRFMHKYVYVKSIVKQFRNIILLVANKTEEKLNHGASYIHTYIIVSSSISVFSTIVLYSYIPIHIYRDTKVFKYICIF